jgi:hypothetical protein
LKIDIKDLSEDELKIAYRIILKIRMIQKETGWGSVSVLIQDKKIKALDFKGTEKINLGNKTNND